MIPFLLSILIDSTPPRPYMQAPTSPLVIVDNKPFYGRIDTLITDTVYFIPPDKIGENSVYGIGGRKGLIIIKTKKK